MWTIAPYFTVWFVVCLKNSLIMTDTCRKSVFTQPYLLLENNVTNCNEPVVNLSRNRLNQHNLHQFCLSDTDQHSLFTILVHQQCTGRIPKLRRYFSVNKPDSDWQVGPITATASWHKCMPSNSHLGFPVVKWCPWSVSYWKLLEELLMYRSRETGVWMGAINDASGEIDKVSSHREETPLGLLCWARWCWGVFIFLSSNCFSIFMECKYASTCL